MKNLSDLHKALETIQEQCSEVNHKCYNCPLRNSLDSCGVLWNGIDDYSSPTEWRLHEETNPRIILN